MSTKTNPSLSLQAHTLNTWSQASAYALLQCLNRFLQTQNNVFPVFVCSGITTCLHVLLCWVLVLKSGLGHKGAALAISVSYWLNVILLSCYVKFSASCSQTWTGFSIEALSHIPAFMKLGFPSAVMVWYIVLTLMIYLVHVGCILFIVSWDWGVNMVDSLELWSFELLVLLSGLLPNPVLETSTLSIW